MTGTTERTIDELYQHDPERADAAAFGRMTDVSRRAFLAGSAGVIAASGFAGGATAVHAQGAKPLPAYVSWKDANSLIVHSDQTIETRREAFGTSLITPEDRLYIRNNVRPPSESIVANRDAWQVAFSGVKQPKTLTVAELKRMGLTTIATVLQCSGNGRKYLQDQLTGDREDQRDALDRRSGRLRDLERRSLEVRGRRTWGRCCRGELRHGNRRRRVPEPGSTRRMSWSSGPCRSGIWRMSSSPGK